MPFYLAYGLTIDSDILLPELVAAEPGSDVVIRIGEACDLSTPFPNAAHWSRLTRAEADLFVDGIGSFHLSGGREVLVHPGQGGDERLLRLVLLGQVMAVLLYQRGWLSLHASAVEIDGEAVVFLGAVGSGKSTVAAALHATGCTLLADDVIGLVTDGKRITLFPAFPQLKLHSDAAVAVGAPDERLMELHPDLSKRSWRVASPLMSGPMPVSRLYVLQEDAAFGVEPISSLEGVIELVRNSVPTRLGHCGDDAHLRQCAQVVRTIPVYVLRRAWDLAALDDVVHLVCEDSLVGTL